MTHRHVATKFQTQGLQEEGYYTAYLHMQRIMPVKKYNLVIDSLFALLTVYDPSCRVLL